MIVNTKQVFLVGIGGIGMSALARYFKHLGLLVYGYDKVETSLTKSLISEGIEVFYEDHVDLLPDSFREFDDHNMVVFTPAIPKDSSILQFLQKVGYRLHKRSEVLGLISRDRFTIAVAGTHGKTTTSSLIAHILTDSGYGCSAFLGGIAANYNSNTLFAPNNTLVVEADEFDRSFLTLHPNIAVVTSVDADHLDVYGDADHVRESFLLFVGQVTTEGKRIIKKGLSLPSDIKYSIDEEADVRGLNIRVQDGVFYFDYLSDNCIIRDVALGMAGAHNVENAVAAIAVAKCMDIADDLITNALANFKGVKRRFEFIVRNSECVYIDDYAHHPVELKACLSAVRHLFPDDHITCIFQPHLFTRTRDFVDDFAEALSLADTLLLMEIYPAREEPIAGIDADWLLSKVTITSKLKLNAEEVLTYVREERPKVIITVGAGNIDLLVDPLKAILTYAE
ncbi:UDP-N-acetylmuramate--L-alanine ligase [Olivibacter sp. SDN3]|uniref:UDP-N-acetylmuramate--L-alanine ligase n=1 Tax=Olivibacter sp. SDN3 TaxID=2764720 RepID=UPI00165147BC|nr:UDP-N-acetylmuramate--L-alanine ligase [Olivibacter sp. SDN3]QNL50117.1 UDP-N-acetylmuramate--L-alanine ligase [Olivibacter sp. SDN3]